MMPATLRPETHLDEPAIRSVVTAAFGQSDEADLIERVRAAPGFDRQLAWVAEIGPRIAGHILFSPILIERPTGESLVPALALAPVSVLPEFQRRSIGGMLIRAGLDACKARGHGIVVVLGHAEYYPRFGFHRADAFGIRPSFDAPPEVFMVLALSPVALDGVSGIVRYPSAFGCG